MTSSPSAYSISGLAPEILRLRAITERLVASAVQELASLTQQIFASRADQRISAVDGS
jgi:hypothetical protein